MVGLGDGASEPQEVVVGTKQEPKGLELHIAIVVGHQQDLCLGLCPLAARH